MAGGDVFLLSDSLCLLIISAGKLNVFIHSTVIAIRYSSGSSAEPFFSQFCGLLLESLLADLLAKVYDIVP
jgi:hypothetical protein